MELLLIRHALPLRVERRDGPADPGLSPDGHAQTERLATYLAAEQLDAVYASPLRRAVETAEPVAVRHGVGVQVVDGVAEWDRDAPDYVPVEELKAAGDERWHALLAGEWNATETAEQFVARVRESIESVVASHRGQRVAVVCHGGVINAYLATVLGVTAAPTAFFYPNYTSIHRIAAASSGERSILTVNETAHLRGSGLPIGLFPQPWIASRSA